MDTRKAGNSKEVVMKKEHSIVMLPSEGPSMILFDTVGNELVYNPPVPQEKTVNVKPQHLYILSDEEIKEGDWCIQGFLSPDEPFQVSEGNIKTAIASKAKKIIATTDPNLFVNVKNHLTSSEGLMVNVPQIPKSFIEEYCKAGGIEDVLVEYTTKLVEGTDLGNDCHYVKPDKPKLNPDYTIIIHPVEEKMYSGEEIVKKFKNLIPQLPITQSDMEGMTEDWIIEKLEL